MLQSHNQITALQGAAYYSSEEDKMKQQQSTQITQDISGLVSGFIADKSRLEFDPDIMGLDRERVVDKLRVEAFERLQRLTADEVADLDRRIAALVSQRSVLVAQVESAKAELGV